MADTTPQRGRTSSPSLAGVDPEGRGSRRSGGDSAPVIDSDRGGLAGAVGPEQHGDLLGPGTDEGEVVEGGDLTETVGHAAQFARSGRGSRRSSFGRCIGDLVIERTPRNSQSRVPVRARAVRVVQVFVLGIDPGLSALRLLLPRRQRSAATGGGPRGPHHAAEPSRSRNGWPSSRARSAACSTSARRRSWPSSGCCSRTTCGPPCRSARPRAWSWPRRPAGARRGRVLAQPGEGRGRRVRRRRQGAGHDDGADAAGAGPSAPSRRRGRRRCDRLVPPGAVARARSRVPTPAIRGRRGDRLAAGHRARSHGHELLVEVGGVGYRLQVTPQTVVRWLGEPGDEVFLWVHHHIREDAQTLYGFASRDERNVFETLIGTHGVGPALGAGDPVGAHPVGAAPGARHRRRRRAVPRARRRQEDGRAAAGRAEVAARAGRGRPHRGRRRRRPWRCRPRRRPRPTSATRWSGSATAPTRSAPRCASCPADGDRPTCCALALQRLAVGVTARPRRRERA